MNTELSYNAPRGMRDFYPEDMALRNAIFQAWTTAARRFGFLPYDACVVESLELLKRKGGEEIVEQLYAFTDKSGRELALRAEMTPTLARMIVARQQELALPLKWFAIAQCFRYERMSRGRKREHYQWNLDIVGEQGLLAEAEVIATALQAVQWLGLNAADVQVHVNSRALLAELFLKAGIPAAHHAVTFLALDKRGKVDDAEIAALLRAAGLDDAHVENAFRILRLATLEEAAALLGEESPALRRLRELFALLGGYGLAEYVRFDISIIRGLGYYTGIVFEGYDAQHSLRALFGGGRYDNLLADLGGQPATAVGLGFGDVVIGELLTAKAWQPGEALARDYAVAFMEPAQQAAAVAAACALRRRGHSVDLALHPEKPKAFFGRVGKSGFRLAIYLGPDDVARGTLRIKDLAARTETETSLAALS